MNGDLTLKQFFNVEDMDFTDVSIDKLNLSTRALNGLMQAAIHTVEQLLEHTERQLSDVKNLGAKSVDEIYSKLKEYAAAAGSFDEQNSACGEIGEFLETVPIEALNLSVRSKNGLDAADIKTMAQLALYSERELYSISNLGAKSVDEIIKKRNDFLSRIYKEFNSGIHERKTHDIKIDENLKTRIEELILNPDYLPADLIDEQADLFNSIKTARRSLGEELTIDVYSEPEKYEAVRDALYEFARDFILYLKRCGQIKSVFDKISSYILEKRLFPFVHAYCLQRNIDVAQWSITPEDNKKVKQFIYLFEDKYRLCEDKEDFSKKALKFVRWLNFDIYDKAAEIIKQFGFGEGKIKDRLIKIIELRSSNMTLEAIGQMYGVTKERARQLVGDALIYLKSTLFNAYPDFILYIYALENGNVVISKETAEKYLGEITPVFMYYLKSDINTKTDAYKYIDVIGIVINGGYLEGIHTAADSVKVLEKFAQSLKPIMNVGVFNFRIEKYCEKNGISPAFGKKYLSKNRKIYGCMICISKPNRTEMFEYILRRHFQDGFKTWNEDYKNRLLFYVKHIFGEDLSDSKIKNIINTIQSIAVIGPGGLYFIRENSDREAEIVKAVNEYIRNSERTFFSFRELFRIFEKTGLFAGTDVTDSHVLHGIINQYKTPYKVSRDSISKKSDYTFLDELESFAEQCGIFSKAEAMNYFAGINESQITQTIDKSSKVFSIEAGLYIYAPEMFDINKEDYEQIYNYLNEVAYRKPLDVEKAYEDLSALCPDFYKRNMIDSKGMLFAALQYMFKDNFKFVRPFITKICETV